MLYGTTRGGGSNETGTVFKMNKNGANYTILYHFGPFGVDGINPYVGVIKGIDGALYGTTRYGGTNGLTPRAMAHYLRYKQMELVIVSYITSVRLLTTPSFQKRLF